jgi:transcriptional regulator GlxA family with amidase domain
MGAQNVLDVDVQAIEYAILSQEENKMVELMENLLRPKLPQKDDHILLVNQIIDQIIREREITKVDHICEYFSINKRKLQRVFDQYVGVSPKWVIQLYRLQNAAETMDHGHNHDWLKLHRQSH